MHFILHSCGDNTLIMEDLVLAGVDVFHPIQAGCMNFKSIAKQYSDKLSFLYGIDVQQLLPKGTPQQVRDSIVIVAREVQHLKGGLLFASGNGIMPDTSLENIEEMLETIHQIDRYI